MSYDRMKVIYNFTAMPSFLFPGYVHFLTQPTLLLRIKLY